MASCALGVRLKPGSSRNKIVAVAEEQVTIAVTAPPVDGKANEALIEFLAEVLDVRKSAIRIKHGHTGRRKVVEVEGMTREEIFKRLIQVPIKS
jgi:uncharacterized protein